MCGFLNGQQPTENWKNYTIVKAKEIKIRATEKVAEKEHKKEPRKPEIKVKESKEKSIGDTVIEEAKVTVVEEVKEDITSEEIERSEEKLIDNDEGKVTKEEYYKRENLRGKFEDYEDEIEDSKEFNPTTGKIRGSIGEYFETIVDGFDRDYDSIDELKYTKWYKIPVHDLHEMCNMSDYNKYTLAYYPMLNYYPYIKKHGYFMIGYKCDSQGNLKHIIYAIPGKKDKDEQPYDGRTGFVTWVNLNGKDNEGCWLMFYDFKNSTVVVPMQ